MKSALVLNFLDSKGTSLAELTIASERIVSKKSGIVGEITTVPTVSYIDEKQSSNVDWIPDIKEISKDVPIQVLCDNNPDIPPVLLLEESAYQIRIKRHSHMLDNEKELQYLMNYGNTLKCSRSLFDDDGQDICYYSFYSKGYVGTCYFNIFQKGIEYRIPFEIRSKKLTYLSDYPAMLEEVADFYTSVLLQSNSPVYSQYALSENNSVSIYEDYVILEHIFTKMDLVGLIGLLNSERKTKLSTHHNEVPIGCASYIDPNAFEQTIIKGMYSQDCQSNNQFVIETTYYDDEDIPENQLIKDLLERIMDELLFLKTTIEKTDSMKGTFIEKRINKMVDETCGLISTPWLKNISRLTAIPYNSSTLQKKHGYKELFLMYQILGLGTKIPSSSLDKMLEGHNKKIYQIYEYWCYIILYKCLKKISENHPSYPLILSNNTWEVDPKKQDNLNFLISHKGYEVSVKLLYNKKFRKTDSNSYSSYSLPLRPDYTLVITLPQSLGSSMHIINFDAKYKVKNMVDQEREDETITSDCWAYDIYKMHTYRDALLKSHGSYIFYPGRKQHHYEKDGQNTVIPSVGAIPLNPGKSEYPELEKLIRSVINKLVMDAEIVTSNSNTDIKS